MAGGFPDVLAEEVFQLRLADAVDQRGGGADKLALHLKEEKPRRALARGVRRHDA